jgi:hypothetical protein
MNGRLDLLLEFLGAAGRGPRPGQRTTARVWLVLVGVIVLHAFVLLVALVWWRNR